MVERGDRLMVAITKGNHIGTDFTYGNSHFAFDEQWFHEFVNSWANFA